MSRFAGSRPIILTLIRFLQAWRGLDFFAENFLADIRHGI